MFASLYIGNDKLDLFKDESVELSSSVANITTMQTSTTLLTQESNMGDALNCMGSLLKKVNGV